MTQPTFTLPPCPACSNILAVNRPYWHHCRNTSKRDGHDIYVLSGCEHAWACGGSGTFHHDGTAFAKVEGDWLELIGLLFEFKMQGWPEDRIEIFRRRLEDRVTVTLPGATIAMDFRTATAPFISAPDFPNP